MIANQAVRYNEVSFLCLEYQRKAKEQKVIPEYLDLDGGRRIAYFRTVGREPGLVFLGGFSSDMDGTKALFLESWAMRQGRSFLRFDYTGHGRSSGRFEDGCISEWSDDAFDTIAALTEGPQIFVGSSMGGWISLLLARRCPDRFHGLVGIAAAPDFTDNFRKNRLTKEQLEKVEQSGVVQIPSDYEDQPFTITKKLLDDGEQNFVLESPLHASFPVRFLQGTADADVDQSTAVRLLNHIEGPDIQLLLVKDADHRFSDQRCLNLLLRTVELLCGYK